jgi:arylsulfatase A-like enzyme
LKWENNPDKAWDAQAMAVHAAMIDRMDQGIGRMLKTLRETGQLDNTLILFLSDNGASPENCAAYGAGFDRPSETRDGRKIAYDLKKQVMPGPQTTYASIGQRWANVANTPYRFWKAESYEGGVHTPLVAFWPKGMKAKKGSFSAQDGSCDGFYEHICRSGRCDLSEGISRPCDYADNRNQSGAVFSGKSTWRVIRRMFNEHFGARYARSGNWKLVSASRDTNWRLFDLATDKTEMNDVAARYPEKVHQLDSLWHRWANTHQVFPKPGKKVR